ncbi:MAG: thiamine phosphate synthase [Epsilonproteobacteria bacterium]|nr:MAG: thiamine phosphate synthase [Campylobacterota bacterium]
MIKYLITDTKYYQNEKQFRQTIQNSFKLHKPDIACFRDKSSNDFEKYAKIFYDISKKQNINKIFINNNIILAKKYKYHGVHLNSNQFNDIKYAKKLGLKVAISCHSLKDVKVALRQKADIATYSPIFKTPSKGQPQGLFALKRATKIYDIPIIALGGIVSKRQIYKIKKIKLKGFASIRYFFK